MPVVSLMQLPMMGLWSEGRQYAALNWPKGAVMVAVRVTRCFRPETMELARQPKRLVEDIRGLGSRVDRFQPWNGREKACTVQSVGEELARCFCGPIARRLPAFW